VQFIQPTIERKTIKWINYKNCNIEIDDILKSEQAKICNVIEDRTVHIQTEQTLQNDNFTSMTMHCKHCIKYITETTAKNTASA